MSTELYRKYIDIINENSNSKVVLEEGILDKAKNMLPNFMKLLGSEAESIANAVKQATGGDFTPSRENIQKVIQALDLKDLPQQTTNEGIAGNWQGKLLQALYSLGVVVGPAMSAVTGEVGRFTVPGALTIIGMLLLLFAGTFFGTGSGQIGAMGKFGNKGWDDEKGNPNPDAF